MMISDVKWEEEARISRQYTELLVQFRMSFEVNVFDSNSFCPIHDTHTFYLTKNQRNLKQLF